MDYISNDLERRALDACLNIGERLGLSEDQAAALPTLQQLEKFFMSATFMDVMLLETIDIKKDASGHHTLGKKEPGEPYINALVSLQSKYTDLRSAFHSRKKQSHLEQVKNELIEAYTEFCEGLASRRNISQDFHPSETFLRIKFPIPPDAPASPETVPGSHRKPKQKDRKLH
jgi:hypothetical protein